MNNNTDPKSKIIDRKTVFQSRYFKIDKATIERDGKIFTKDIIVRNPHVLILPITKDNEVYLVSEYRDAFGKSKLEVVAGYMEAKDKDPLEAAKRELHEETGLTAKKWTYLGEKHTSANMISKAHIFIAEDLQEGEQDLDEDEQIQLVKMPFDEALEKVMDGEIDIFAYIGVILLVDKLRREGEI